MTKLTITLPWPDMRLMPNRKNGRHWGGTQAAKVKARQDGYFATKQAVRGGIDVNGRIALRMTFVAPDNRHRDLDNLLAACKANLDGIAQALGIDDRRFSPITLDVDVDPSKRGFLIVEIG